MSSKINAMNLFVVTIFLFGICSCKAKVHNKAELQSYINNQDNGLSQTRHVGEIDVTLTFHPWQLMVKNDADDQGQMKVVGDKYYFVLGLSSHKKELLKQLDESLNGSGVKTHKPKAEGFFEGVKRFFDDLTG